MSQYAEKLPTEFYAAEGEPFGERVGTRYVFANQGFYWTARAAELANRGYKVWKATITWEEVE